MNRENVREPGLVVTVKEGEAIKIGEAVVVFIGRKNCSSNGARLRIVAPREIIVERIGKNDGDVDHVS